MAYPQLVGRKLASFASISTAGETISLTDLAGGLASAPVEGDLIVVGCAASSTTTTFNLGIATPSGSDYSIIGSVYPTVDTYRTTLRSSYRRAGPTPDTGVKVTSDIATDGAVVMISVWRGVDPDTAFDVSGASASGFNGGVPNPASITPVTPGALILVFAAGASGYFAATPLTSSDLTDFQSATGGAASGADISAGMGYHEWTSGAFDPAAMGGGSSSSSNNWAAMTMALRPAVLPTAEGVLTATLADTTLTATGSVPATGYLNAVTLSNTALVAAGAVPISGGGTIALDDAALTATGDVSGDGLAVTFADMTLGASATTPIAGTGDITLAASALTATGDVPATGASSIVLSGSTLLASADITGAGSLTATFANMGLAGSGAVIDTPFPSDAGIAPEAYTTLLVEIAPLDPADGTRKTIRATSVNDHRVTGLNDLIWRPAISENARLAIRLFKGDFDGTAAPASGNIALQIDQLLPQQANARRFIWVGAAIKIWAGKAGDAWPWTQVFDGLVGDNPRAERNRITLPIEPNTEPFEADVLTLKYAGTGDAEGGEDLTDKPKPWLLGRCFNAQPVLINTVDSVFQFSAYGAIEAVTKLYERGSDFGASVGDYADYAALVAADIPPGRWATCLAQGMVRLGAPPAGVITGDVDGDKSGGTWRRKTGEIITRVATNAGASSHLDAASLSALDTAVAAVATANQGRIGVFLTEQESLLDFAARLASPCNAQAGISLMGKLFVSRVAIGSPAMTLDAQQREMPRVTKSVELGTRPPFFRVEMGYARSWRVHSTDEIAYYADLIERGLYDALKFYREGNIVSSDDGSRWVYINPEPTSGNAPPTWPTTSNAYWENLTPPLRFQVDAKLKPDRVRLPADDNGTILSYAPATFAFIAKQTDGVDVSTSFVLSIPSGGNPDGVTYTIDNGADPPTVTVTGGLVESEMPGELTILATGGGDFSGVVFERTATMDIDYTDTMLQRLLTANDNNTLVPDTPTGLTSLTLQTTHPDGTVTYTGTFGFTYSTDPDHKNSIDGFAIFHHAQPTNAAYTLSLVDSPGIEYINVIPASHTKIFLDKVDPTQYHYVGVAAARKINPGAAAPGQPAYILSAIKQYGPFRPASKQVALPGLDLSGTDGFATELDGPSLVLPIQRVQTTQVIPLKNTNPRSVQLKYTKQGVDHTASASWAIDSYYNCTATISSGGRLEVTGTNLGQVISGNRGNAYVRIVGTYEGVPKYYLVAFEIELDPPVSISGTTVTPVVVANPLSIAGFSLTSYVTFSDTLRISTGPTGWQRLCFVYNYSSPYGGGFRPIFKFQMKKASSGTWGDGFVDLAATGVDYDPIYERKRAFAYLIDLSGLDANTNYDYRVLVRRDASYGTMSGDVEGLSFWGLGW